MKQFLFGIGLMLLGMSATAQVIPDERRVDWKQIALQYHFKLPETAVNVRDFGATGDGITNDQPAIINAIASLQGRLGYIYFPPGNYLITSPVALVDSVVLIGVSSDSCILHFDLGQQAISCINVSGSPVSEFVGLSESATMGSSWLKVNNTAGFAAGMTAELIQSNGSWDVVPVSWAENAVGQLLQISAVVEDTLFFINSLRTDFSIELQARIRTIDPLVNAGIHCLKIIRTDEPVSGAGSNIDLVFAKNCSFSGIESDHSVGSHFQLHNCSNILIKGCYIHHAFTYDGTGTRGYGVTLNQHSGECLVVNNIFQQLRHAMMVKTGANGNIFAYNYSIDPYRSEEIHDFSGDISLHGHYAFSNLFEGNIVQNIIIDHYWGPSGPLNTFFRNRAELYGIIMTPSDLLETQEQNIVGNEVTSTAFLHGLYSLTGSDHFEYGNNIKGSIVPPGTDVLSDTSYYLDKQPTFWENDLSWPSVGVPNELNSGQIPASLRYIDGNTLTVCSQDSTLTENPQTKHEQEFIVWPNPARQWVQLQLPGTDNRIVSIELIGMHGNRTTLHVKPSVDANIIVAEIPQALPQGMYFVVVRTKQRTIASKLMLVP
ncbi:MAG: T9SS type A sorting domain-containing protein [Bacteroidales bacterium]|nr:T9SS type A sorting domain-containing protein [Bacteroidales bacterium]